MFPSRGPEHPLGSSASVPNTNHSNSLRNRWQCHAPDCWKSCEHSSRGIGHPSYSPLGQGRLRLAISLQHLQVLLEFISGNLCPVIGPFDPLVRDEFLEQGLAKGFGH